MKEVLGIQLNNCTAKEAMETVIKYMGEEQLQVVEMATVDGLMSVMEREDSGESIKNFDLILAGDTAVLETAGIADKQLLRETKEQTFLKLFLQFLHKNHKRIYLLGENEEDCTRYYEYFMHRYPGCQIVGVAKVSAKDPADDMVVNAINGSECDCILSRLPASLQEDFIIRNQRQLNARVWLGVGKNPLPGEKNTSPMMRMGDFILRHIFKKEITKRKKNMEKNLEKSE